MKPLPASVKNQTLRLFPLILLPLVAYFNSLMGSFQYDDLALLDRVWISDLDHFWKEVQFFPSQGPVNMRAIGHRPVLLLTYAINNALHPQSVFGFHLLNLLFHILSTVLVFFTIRLSQKFLYPDPSPKPAGAGKTDAETQSPAGPRSFTLPLAAALLFALHPLATDAVSYISSRSTLLASFFYLLTLFVFLRMFPIPGSAAPRRWIFPVFAAVLLPCGYYLALASKLTAATLPALLFVWFVFVISPRRYPRLHSLLTSGKMALAYVLFLAVLLAKAVKHTSMDQGLEMYGRIPYFLVQLKVVVFYYPKLFLFPINLNVDVGFPFTKFGDDFWIALAAIAICGTLAYVLTRGSLLLKAGTLWFFLTLAPTSSLIPLNDLAAERRVYLPMALGLCLVSGVWATGMPGLRRRRRELLVFLLVAASALTAARNGMWINELTLWQDSLKKNPRSPRPYNNVGKAYYERNEKSLSLEYLQKSIDLDPNFAEPHYNIANVYMDMKRLDDAEREYRKAIDLKPLHYAAHLGLGSVYNQTGRYSEAIKRYKLAIDTRRNSVAQNEDYPLARLNLGEVYGVLGRLEDAVRESKRALELSPSLYKAHYNLGTAYLKLGDLENAERSFLACLQANGQFEKAQFNLAHLYQLKNEWEKSNAWFEKFLEHEGPRAKAYFGIAWNYQKMSRWEMTRKFYEKALAEDPNYLSARVNLANVYIQLKRFDLALGQFEKVLQQQPGQARVHVQLGLLYWKAKGDKSRAMAHFSKALELSERPREKSEISRLIQSLRQT
ncbi:MAG: tetratricopeptide repeat protein [Nitrospinales bacterium]